MCNLTAVAGCDARRLTCRSASTLGGPLQGAGNAAARPVRPEKLCSLFLRGALLFAGRHDARNHATCHMGRHKMYARYAVGRQSNCNWPTEKRALLSPNQSLNS
jgi:hypothetical protein